jgi:tetratricopeptide (TPR) repeat protein
VLTPPGHPDRAMSLMGNIASALKTRFEQDGDRQDLEEAIQHHRDALVLRPPGHPLRGSSLNNIANALWTRFGQGGDRKDLEEAIQHYRDALVLRPPGHPLVPVTEQYWQCTPDTIRAGW